MNDRKTSHEELLINLLYDLVLDAEAAPNDSQREWTCGTMRKVIELYYQLRIELK